MRASGDLKPLVPKGSVSASLRSAQNRRPPDVVRPITCRHRLSFGSLIANVENIHSLTNAYAKGAVNQLLTIRDWSDAIHTR